MTNKHVTIVLLYSILAGMCKEKTFPLLLAVISDLVCCIYLNNDPLIIHAIVPVVTLQLKVAVVPSVALIGVGVLSKAGIIKNVDNEALYFYKVCTSRDRVEPHNNGRSFPINTSNTI